MSEAKSTYAYVEQLEASCQSWRERAQRAEEKLAEARGALEEITRRPGLDSIRIARQALEEER